MAVKKEVLSLWIKSVQSFTEEPSYLQLRFPMRIESAKGDMWSPEGLLCDIHSKETVTEWLPKEPARKGRMREYINYFGSSLTCPQEVLDWAGMTQSQMANVRRVNSEKGFEGVVEYLKTLKTC